MLRLNPPLNKQHSFSSEPSKDLPWLRIRTPSSHSRASVSPRCWKMRCPSKITTLIGVSTRPPASSYSKSRTRYGIVWERSNSFERPSSSKVPIPLLNGRIFVCPTVGIKAGLTVIFAKVRTRFTIIRAVSLISFVRIYLSLFRNPPGNGSSAPPLGNSVRDPASQGYIFLMFFLPFGVGVENACRGRAQNVQHFANSQNADT
jgi:hypothetical protein